MAIFKVLYQEDKAEVIIRENTQVRYFDAVSEEQVRNLKVHTLSMNKKLITTAWRKFNETIKQK